MLCNIDGGWFELTETYLVEALGLMKGLYEPSSRFSYVLLMEGGLT